MTEGDERRVALVTGAARGLGAAIAVRLACDGMAIAVNDIEDSDPGDVLTSIRDEGSEAISALGDVSDPTAVDRIVDMILDRWGRVDVLVNNAGIFPWTPWQEIPPEEWDRVMAVNVRGCFLLARRCVPDMRRRRWGRVVSMSSATYLTGAPNLMHYSASKAAVVGFTRSLARAVGDDNITVNAVTTGKTHTEGLDVWFKNGTLSYEDTLRSRQDQCIKRMGRPEDVAGTVSFLVSNDAAYLTGQLLNVDGGRQFH